MNCGLDDDDLREYVCDANKSCLLPLIPCARARILSDEQESTGFVVSYRAGNTGIIPVCYTVNGFGKGGAK